MTAEVSGDPLRRAETALAQARQALAEALAAVDTAALAVNWAASDREMDQLHAWWLASRVGSVIDVPDGVPAEWSDVDSGQ